MSMPCAIQVSNQSGNTITYKTDTGRPAGQIEYSPHALKPWKAIPYSVMDSFQFSSWSAACYYLLACAIEDWERAK